MQVDLSAKFGKAKRFDYARENQLSAEKSKGPTTAEQISSFNLPEIYQKKLPKSPSKVLATTFHEYIENIRSQERLRPKISGTRLTSMGSAEFLNMDETTMSAGNDAVSYEDHHI